MTNRGLLVYGCRVNSNQETTATNIISSSVDIETFIHCYEKHEKGYLGPGRPRGLLVHRGQPQPSQAGYISAAASADSVGMPSWGVFVELGRTQSCGASNSRPRETCAKRRRNLFCLLPNLTQPRPLVAEVDKVKCSSFEARKSAQ